MKQSVYFGLLLVLGMLSFHLGFGLLMWGDIGGAVAFAIAAFGCFLWGALQMRAQTHAHHHHHYGSAAGDGRI